MKMTQINGSKLFSGAFSDGKEMDIRERIAGKKQLYQKQGMHMVTTAFNSEKKVDQSIEDSKERYQRLLQENQENAEAIRDIRKRGEDLKAEYSIEDDSAEQQDLELMQKAYRLKEQGKWDHLSEEEKTRLKEMGKPTEYQSRAMELYEQEVFYGKQMEKTARKMQGEASVERAVAIDRLKSQGMLKAQKAKEELLELASQEAVNMLVDDAKQQIDEKAEEIQEAAEERQEKKEEEEKRVEAAKENRTETEAAVENARENVRDLTQQVLKSDDISQDVDEVIKKIIEEEKLLEEELKGLEVDQKI